MNKTLTVVELARKAREIKAMKFEATTHTAISDAIHPTETETLKLAGKFAAPNSLHLVMDAMDGESSIYAHNGETYCVLGETVKKLDQDDQDEFTQQINLDEITMKDFDRLVIYAEEMDFQTEEGVTTITLPDSAITSRFVQEHIEAMEMSKKATSFTVKKMEYEVKFNASYELISFYNFVDIVLKDDSFGELHVTVEMGVNYFPLAEDEDFSIPKAIIEASQF